MSVFDDGADWEKRVLETIERENKKVKKKEQTTHCSFCNRSKSVNKSIDRCDDCGARFK